MVVTAVVKAFVFTRKKSTPHPKLRQYKSERKVLCSTKKKTIKCTKPEGKQAKLFKGEKTDSKGYTKRTYRSSETDCKTVQLENNAVAKAQV